jgi:hypothetical protein
MYLYKTTPPPPHVPGGEKAKGGMSKDRVQIEWNLKTWAKIIAKKRITGRK